MFTARKASEADLEIITSIYKKKTDITVYKNYFQNYINESNKGIYLTVYNNIIFGFSSFEPDKDISNCLLISNFYFDFSKIRNISENNIKGTKCGMILFLMNKASEMKYKKMSIIGNNINGIHDICISYNAKVVDFCGLMYSYHEKLVFDIK